MPPDQKTRVHRFIQKTLAAGRQVLVVCPAEIEGAARELTGGVPANVQFVDPTAVLDAAQQLLS